MQQHMGFNKVYYLYTMILEWLFTFLVVYLLYKLIFDFIIPVSRASSQMRNKINQMHQQQQQQYHQQTTNQQSSKQETVKPSKEDYIDFEEIK